MLLLNTSQIVLIQIQNKSASTKATFKYFPFMIVASRQIHALLSIDVAYGKFRHLGFKD